MTIPRLRKRLRNFAAIAFLCFVSAFQQACERLGAHRPHSSEKSVAVTPLSQAQDKENQPERTETVSLSAPESAPVPPQGEKKTEDAAGRPFPARTEDESRTSQSLPAPVPLHTRTPKPTLERVTSPGTDRAGEQPPSTELADAGPSAARPGFEEVRKALFPGVGGSGQKPGAAAPEAETRKSDGATEAKGAILLNTFSYHYGNARKLMEIGEYERAADELRRALELTPDNLECRLCYGECLEKTGKAVQALTEYRTAASQHVLEPRPYLKIGNVYLRDSKNLEKAREAYQKCLEIQPDYKFALFNLGLLEKTAGHPDKAIAFFEKVLRADGDYAEAHLYLALLLQTEERDLSGAARHFTRYLELQGEHSDMARSFLNRLNKEAGAE